MINCYDKILDRIAEVKIMKKIALFTVNILSSIFLFGYSSAMNVQKFFVADENGKTEVTRDFIDRSAGHQLINVHQKVTYSLIRQCLYIEKCLYNYCNSPLIVIIGCSCSGKSFIENRLSEYFGNRLYHFPEGPVFWSLIDGMVQEETKKTVISTFPQNMCDLIKDRDGSSHFADRFHAECCHMLGVEQGNRIVEKYKKMSIEFIGDVTAKLIIANSSQKQIMVTTHEHTYDDFLLLKCALERNFFRMPIYPVFMYVPPKKIAERLIIRNMMVVNRELPYYDSRLNARSFLEFFQNLRPAISGENAIDSLSLQKMHQILSHTFFHDFPRISSVLKNQYPQLISFDFEGFFNRIKLNAFDVVNTFFMNKDTVDVTFIGGHDVYCLTLESEIEEFLKYLYSLSRCVGCS